jgi:pimeloyl-ACP methyl ester carboxylesterase
MEVQQSARTQPMQCARVDGDGTEVEFEIVGSASGKPVVLIHGALLATAYAPLCAEPVLATHELIRYHRRGYAGSSHPSGPASIARQAADCRALLAHLGVERAHVVGHSSGGAIALQLALDAPEVVHSLVLLEPALLDVPNGALIEAAVGPSIRLYEAGEKEAATDGFLRFAIGPAYREFVDRLFPGGYAQAVADADTFFSVELPALQTWRLPERTRSASASPYCRSWGKRASKTGRVGQRCTPASRSGCPRPSRSFSAVRTTRSRKWTPAGSPRPWTRSSPATRFPRRRRPRGVDAGAPGRVRRTVREGERRPSGRLRHDLFG